MSDFNKLVQSATSFVLDTKPFHTKLRHVGIRVDFNDLMKLKLLDDTACIQTYLQNLWRRTDVGGHRLHDVISGSTPDYRIPFFHTPRYSLNDFLNGQQYPAFDPVTTSIVDVDMDGFADNNYPWRQQFSWSHQDTTNQIPINVQIDAQYQLISVSPHPIDPNNIFRVRIEYSTTFNPQLPNRFGVVSTPVIFNNGLQVIPIITDDDYSLMHIIDITVQPGDLLYSLITATRASDQDYWQLARLKWIKNNLVAVYTGDTGRYHVPFHNGSRVYVMGIKQVYAVDYIVDKSRGFVQFLNGRHPHADQLIDINYFLVDRFFISVNRPFEHHIQYDYDSHPMDFMPYDWGVIGDSFYFTVDNNSMGHSPVEFFNITPGTTKGSLQNFIVDLNHARIGDSYRFMADSEYSFVVFKNGVLQSRALTYDEPFSFDGISGVITNTWCNYYINPDLNSYRVYDLDQFYDEFDLDTVEYDVNDGITTPYELDIQDHLMDLDIQTIRGRDSNNMPVHNDYDINPFGHIVELVDSNGLQYFVFRFVDQLRSGDRVEFRVEQAEQYNQTVNVDMRDSVDIREYQTNVHIIQKNVTLLDSIINYKPSISTVSLLPLVDISYFTSSLYPLLISEDHMVINKPSIKSTIMYDQISDSMSSVLPVIANVTLIDSIVYKSINVSDDSMSPVLPVIANVTLIDSIVYKSINVADDSMSPVLPVIANVTLINTYNPITYNETIDSLNQHKPIIKNMSLL